MAPPPVAALPPAVAPPAAAAPASPAPFTPSDLRSPPWSRASPPPPPTPEGSPPTPPWPPPWAPLWALLAARPSRSPAVCCCSRRSCSSNFPSEASSWPSTCALRSAWVWAGSPGSAVPSPRVPAAAPPAAVFAALPEAPPALPVVPAALLPVLLAPALPALLLPALVLLLPEDVGCFEPELPCEPASPGIDGGDPVGDEVGDGMEGGLLLPEVAQAVRSEAATQTMGSSSFTGPAPMR